MSYHGKNPDMTRSLGTSSKLETGWNGKHGYVNLSKDSFYWTSSPHLKWTNLLITKLHPTNLGNNILYFCFVFLSSTRVICQWQMRDTVWYVPSFREGSKGLQLERPSSSVHHRTWRHLCRGSHANLPKRSLQVLECRLLTTEMVPSTGALAHNEIVFFDDSAIESSLSRPPFIFVPAQPSVCEAFRSLRFSI